MLVSRRLDIMTGRKEVGERENAISLPLEMEEGATSKGI